MATVAGLGTSQSWRNALTRGVPSLYRSVRTILSSRLFVGGLAFETREDSLTRAFSPHGDIEDVRVIKDRETGRSKGFGFVTFSSEADAEAALQEMDGKIVDGRAIRVDYAAIPTGPKGGKGGFKGFGAY